MADTTPISNQLNITLSYRLDDAVTGSDNGVAAATDGKTWTAARRNDYIAVGCRSLIMEMAKKTDVETVSVLLQGAVATQSITFASSGVSVNKDMMIPLRVYTSTKLYVLSPKSDLERDYNPILNNAFALQGGKLYGYTRTAGTLAVLNSGTATFTYLAAPRVSTSTGANVAVNTAPDVSLDARWYDAIVLFAAAEACNDKSIIDSEPAWKEKGGAFYAQAMAKLTA